MAEEKSDEIIRKDLITNSESLHQVPGFFYLDGIQFDCQDKIFLLRQKNWA
jgi:hypothetical protein